MSKLELDPIGYFVIRVRENKIEIGFCKYQEAHKQGGYAKNIFEEILLSDDEQEILDWIDKNDYISFKHHEEYIKKEIRKAQECIKNKTKYVQD